MRWENKARIMRFCSWIPWGDRIYKNIQKTFGRLQANPMSRLPVQVKMATWLDNQGHGVVDKHFFEVGTGHVPVAPIGFFLCGAGSVMSADLHRRIDWRLTQQTLEWIAAHSNEVLELYNQLNGGGIVSERFSILHRFQHDPIKFLKEANIKYMAPMDASRTDLPDNSIDCHFSITVMEHIPPDTIQDIFIEAKRIVKSTGAVIHFIDMSDHFQHSDPSISRINFLQFSENDWEKIAGNEFAYCNRMRESDYLSLFQNLNFKIDKLESHIDQESLKCLQRSNIVLDSIFEKHTYTDICTTSLKVMLSQQVSKDI
ncbi:methyltransferase domain-containing protein [Desulfovermiculus halophilus]|uniref:methyltransferase domain-containing protein n=1 Tax=Desulfovermiculus halophilus TaxID=339722 RepID=UPI001377921E|nr:methyltransferase domain-containing protein [Desulfovermiculus halophilus]